jgi:hypothetical protein
MLMEIDDGEYVCVHNHPGFSSTIYPGKVYLMIKTHEWRGAIVYNIFDTERHYIGCLDSEDLFNNMFVLSKIFYRDDKIYKILE